MIKKPLNDLLEEIRLENHYKESGSWSSAIIYAIIILAVYLFASSNF